MQFKYTTAVVLVSLIGAQSAAIVSLNETSQQEQDIGQGLVLLSSETVPSGNLAIWGGPTMAL